jgi:hypothetical protein
MVNGRPYIFTETLLRRDLIIQPKEAWDKNEETGIRLSDGRVNLSIIEEDEATTLQCLTALAAVEMHNVAARTNEGSLEKLIGS